jgi:capsular exopolysaccharide synthesis family protein
MTIEDAIRRAKILGQARLHQQGQPGEARHPEAHRYVDAGRDSTRTDAMPSVHFEPLQTVEISSDACEANRVLVLESQLKEFPTADAAYRLLRSRLQNRLKQNNWFSLAIASPSQSDGKTLTALNLAVSIARERQKPVYLLDLDMRNPSICRFLGVRDIRSLPDYLLGQAKPEEVLFQTNLPNFIIAGAMAPADNASEMLAGPRFGELLTHIRLRSPNAFVLVDLPPVNVTDEALLVGPRVDAFLMVVSEGKTERKNLAQAVATLSEFVVAGVVVNRSSDSHTTEYSHYSA